MKKVLLTTTALTLVAGVAAAEITFSGSGEAGFYRTGKVAAVAAKAGVLTGSYTDVSGVSTLGTTAIASLTAATTAYTTELEDLRQAEQALSVMTAGDTLADIIAKDAAIEDAKYALAIAKSNYDLAKGSAAVAAVKAGDMKAYSGYDFNVAASGASDNGMTFAMGFDMGAGHIADQDDDRAMDAQAGTIDTSGLTIGYNGYTIVIGDEKVDDLYDADGWNADVSLSGSFGDLTFSLATDMDKDVAAVAATTDTLKAADTTNGAAGTPGYVAKTFVAATAGTAAVYNPTSYSIGYKMGDMSFSMAGTDHDAFGNAAAKYSLTYALLPSLSATLSSDNLGTYKDVGKLSATYTVSDAMKITASVKDDKDHALNTNKGGKQSNDFSIAYTSGVLSATVATDESSNWWVNAKYDLGGGATAFTTFDHTEFLVAGVNFKF